MKTDSKKNPKPLAPASTAPTASTSAKPRVVMPEKGTLVKKKNTAAGDPTKMAKPSRTKVLARSGARYGIRVKFQKTEAPEAGATQGNGRLVPSSVVRSADNFKAGSADLN